MTMKIWIFMLVVLASASSIVNTHIDLPGNARPVATHIIGTD